MNFKHIFDICKKAVMAWVDDFAPSMGAAISYYTVFSIAPLLISFLPCAAMCALGLCMTQMKGRGAATGPAAGPSSTTLLGPPPPSDRNDPLEAQVSGDDVTKVGVRACIDA